MSLPNKFNVIELFAFMSMGVFMSMGGFLGLISYSAHYQNNNVQVNGTFVLNGTEEWHYLQYMEHGKKQLMQFYDLQQVIAGNLCKEKYGNYITDITPQSFRLQCCQNFTSCENYIIIDKNIKEVRLR